MIYVATILIGLFLFLDIIFNIIKFFMYRKINKKHEKRDCSNDLVGDDNEH